MVAVFTTPWQVSRGGQELRCGGGLQLATRSATEYGRHFVTRIMLNDLEAIRQGQLEHSSSELVSLFSDPRDVFPKMLTDKLMALSDNDFTGYLYVYLCLQFINTTTFP